MPSTSTEDVFVGRQPILDRSGQIEAYELLFRSGQSNRADVVDDLLATMTVLNHVFSQIGLEAVLGPYRGFINVDGPFLMSDLVETLPSDRIVLEILETVEVTPALVERCQALRSMGYTLALDDFSVEEEKYWPLLPCIDIVKVDIQLLSPEQLGEVTRALQQWPVKLLAEKVDSQEQADLLRNLGYELFQGYYFAKPVVMAGKRLSSSQLALIRLFGLLVADADISELEQVLKPEPGLTLNLMRLSNSAAGGANVQITSLRQAITMLGRRQLQRWLQLLLFTNPTGGTGASPLLQLAASRGRFMELAAGRLSHGDDDMEDHAFMTGIVSLLPALLGLPMEELLRGLPVATDVSSALLERRGILGDLLDLTESLEAADGSLPALQLPSGLDAAAVNLSLAEALAWAHKVGR